MNISGLNSDVTNSAMLQMKQQIDSIMKSAVNKANSDNGNPFGDSVDFSNPSDLLSKLSQLKSQDPDKFKAVMQEISDNLKQAASGTDAKESKFLQGLSEKFANAAQTGDLSQLQPPQKPPSGGTGGIADKIAQYASQLSDSDQQTLLTFLEQLSSSNKSSSTNSKSSSDNDSGKTTSSSSTNSTDNTTTLKNLLTSVFQKLMGSNQN